jgi:hypothetical protein
MARHTHREGTTRPKARGHRRWTDHWNRELGLMPPLERPADWHASRGATEGTASGSGATIRASTKAENGTSAYPCATPREIATDCEVL